jgi:hypothetical protein
MTPRRNAGWSYTISVLDKYLSLRDDWPVTSPLGRLNEGGTDDVRRGVGGTLAWVVDIGSCLAQMPVNERETVLECAIERHAEHDAAARARNSDMSAKRSGAVHDVRDLHQRSKREWRRIADDHQRQRRKIERRKAYRDGMDLLTVLVLEVESD